MYHVQARKYKRLYSGTILQFKSKHDAQRRSSVFRIRQCTHGIFGQRSGTSKKRAKSSHFRHLLGFENGSYAALAPVLFPDGKPSTQNNKDIFRSWYIVNVSNFLVTTVELYAS